MRAELHGIDPNDSLGWEAFVTAELAEPWDHFAWFTLYIGPEGSPGADLFQVCVSTPSAVSRASGKRGKFRGLVVDSFEPEVIRQRLTELVSSTTGHTWEDIVEQLRLTMHWEYEGMGEPR
jgi:Immunity protein 8